MNARNSRREHAWTAWRRNVLGVVALCVVALGSSTPAQEAGPGRGQGNQAEATFKRYDKIGVSKLDRNELPAALFDRLDADKDGFVTEEEAKALSASKPRSSEPK